MSVQNEIDRITQNVQNTYAMLSALGADMPEDQNSDNLATTAGTAKAVLYVSQSLDASQKEQARKNIDAISKDDVKPLVVNITESDTGLVANKTATEILIAHGTGQYVYGEMNGVILQLAGASEEMALFILNTGTEIALIIVLPDKTVQMQSSIPVTEESLPEVVNSALAQAKASGEFDGTSVTVKSVSESTADGGSNVVTFSDGKSITIKNGSKGSTGETGPQGPAYTLTTTDKNAIAATVKSSISASDVKNILGYTPADEEDTSVVTNMVVGVGVSVPSINLNDGVYEYGRFAAAGTDYSDSKAFRTKNYLRVEGGRTITFWYAKAEWNNNNAGFPVQVVQYADDPDKTILVARTDVTPYVGDPKGFTLNENTAYVRFDVYRNVTISTALTDIELAMYYIEDYVAGYVSPEPTIVGEKKLSLQDAVIPSSTPGSTKKFYLTIDDNGTITPVEVT